MLTNVETQQERAKRNELVKMNNRRRIENGGVTHEVWVTRAIGLPGMEEQVAPVVELANDDDGNYVQVFRCRDELETFVAKLLAAADDAWPNGA